MGRTWWRCCSPASLLRHLVLFWFKQHHSGHGSIDESSSDLFQRSTLVFILGLKLQKKQLTFSKEMFGWVESCWVVKSCTLWCETVWNAVTTFSDRTLHKWYILRVESVCTKQVTCLLLPTVAGSTLCNWNIFSWVFVTSLLHTHTSY